MYAIRSDSYLQGTTIKRNTLALCHVEKSLDYQIGKYENLILIGDFNSQMEEDAIKEFYDTYNLKNLITEPTCFKNAQNRTLIDYSDKQTKKFSQFNVY